MFFLFQIYINRIKNLLALKKNEIFLKLKKIENTFRILNSKSLKAKKLNGYIENFLIFRTVN